MAARRSIGVYQPRSRRSAMADALAEARLAMARLLRMLTLRGAGLLLFLCTAASLLALATYNPADPSLDNATAYAPTNLLGALGAIAADLLLQTFGIAALAALAPPAVWGVRALTGRALSHAMWRALAWPLGAVLAAAGLGAFPAPQALPAGAGGLIGIAAAGLSHHAGQVYGLGWLDTALPLLLLVVGLPLAFLATGLRFAPLARSVASTCPASFVWMGSKVRIARSLAQFPFRRADAEADDDDEYEWEDEDDDDDGRRLRAQAASRTDRGDTAGRAARTAASSARRPAARPRPSTPRQPALNLSSGEYQIARTGASGRTRPSCRITSRFPTKRWKKTRACSKPCCRISACAGASPPCAPARSSRFTNSSRPPASNPRRVISLADDVARSMSAVAARIAVIPGRNVMGIELPNQQPRDRLPARAARERTNTKRRAHRLSWRWARPSAAIR